MRKCSRPSDLISSGLQAVHPCLEGGSLALLLDDPVDLRARLLHHLLDARGMDASVLDELVQRLPRDLAAHRVEAGQDHCLRRVVDDEIDARCHLQRADVAPLAADDAALHLLARQRYDRTPMTPDT